MLQSGEMVFLPRWAFFEFATYNIEPNDYYYCFSGVPFAAEYVFLWVRPGLLLLKHQIRL